MCLRKVKENVTAHSFWQLTVLLSLILRNISGLRDAERLQAVTVSGGDVYLEKNLSEEEVETEINGVRANDTLCTMVTIENGILTFVHVESIFNNSTNNKSWECPQQQLKHAPQFLPATIARVVTLSVIAAISFVGNIATLVSIMKNYSKSRSTIYLLIAHLAIADLLVTTFCVLAEAIWTYTVQWVAGNEACKLIKFLQMFSLYLSTFILVIIGFDRYTAVRFPMRKANAKRRVKKLVIAVWILSALFSVPQMVIFRVVKGPFLEEFYQCVTYGFYTADWQEQLYTTISLVLMFLLPLVILMFTYICTFYTIAKKEHSFADRPRTVMDDARRKLLRKAKMKALMITVVIVMAFVICWTPYYCMMIIFIFLNPDEQLSEELQAAIFFFGSSTAMINPLIYGAFHLRRRPARAKAQNNSSGSSRAENTVMLITFRKSRLLQIPKPEEMDALQAKYGCKKSPVFDVSGSLKQRCSNGNIPENT